MASTKRMRNLERPQVFVQFEELFFGLAKASGSPGCCSNRKIPLNSRCHLESMVVLFSKLELGRMIFAQFSFGKLIVLWK